MSKFEAIHNAVEAGVKEEIGDVPKLSEKIKFRFPARNSRRDLLKVILKRLRDKGIADDDDYFPALWPTVIANHNYYWLIDELEVLLCD